MTYTKTAAAIMQRAERVDALAEEAFALIREIDELEPQFRSELKATGEPLTFRGRHDGFAGLANAARREIRLALGGDTTWLKRRPLATMLQTEWGHLLTKGKSK